LIPGTAGVTEDRHQEFLRRYAEAERRILEGGDPMKELAAIAETTVASLTADQRANVERNLPEKDVPRRLIEFTEVMNEILQGERPVVAGETIEQRAAQFEQSSSTRAPYGATRWRCSSAAASGRRHFSRSHVWRRLGREASPAFRCSLVCWRRNGVPRLKARESVVERVPCTRTHRSTYSSLRKER
jgi:hypothetical protein